jgi:hypothetical protein
VTRGVKTSSFLAVLAVSGLLPVYGANPSDSKLSVQIYFQYTNGANQILSAHPKVLKILKTDLAMMEAARDFKACTPGGKVVVRPMGSAPSYSIADDPAGAATQYFNLVIQPALPPLSDPSHAWIDYVEGPNECDNTPGLGAGTSAWFNTFWLRMGQLIHDAGYLPCLCSTAVGNPGGTQADIDSAIRQFIPALRQAHAWGGAWSYHAYTYTYSTDPNGDDAYNHSLRYRRFYDLLSREAPDLMDMTMILTEGGAEEYGGGWKVHGDQVDFTNWLTWYDGQLQQDPYILGITLFEIGNPGRWGGYDVEDIAPWIAAHLQNQIIIPSSPYEVTATSAPDQVVIKWMGGYGSTSYKLKRATASGGPYTTLTPLTARTYTDTAVFNGTTYYYVVSGLTSAGESANSSQVGVTPGDGFAINCGGGNSGIFGGDAYFSGGEAYSVTYNINTSGVTNPAPMAVYQTNRAGKQESPTFSYTFDGLSPGGPYNVRLHFAETYCQNAGARVFNVLINGSQVLSSFDIFAVAGGWLKAVDRQFSAAANANGQIVIQFNRGGAGNPLVSAIQVTSNGPPPAPAAPTGLTAAAGDAQVTLSWNVTAGATSYKVKRSSNDGGPYTTIATGLTTATYTNTGLTNGTTCYYVVSAVNLYGESGNSTQAFAIPMAPLAKCDFDRDGDVDQEDFGRFQACVMGSGVVQDDPACAGALLDSDEDVDQSDLARFLMCISGANVPADPYCAN